jgi:Protein of unknown function (DUF559)
MASQRSVRSRDDGVDRAIGSLAGRQHGVVARRQLRELGIGVDRIEGRRRRAQLHLLYRGVYAVGHRTLTAEGRWMAAVLASGPDAVLSHRSAAHLWGLLPRSGSAPEVTRRTASRPRPGIRAHRSILPADEVEEVERIPVTSVSRTLLDLAAILSVPRLEQAMNEAEIRRLYGCLSLLDLLDRYPGRRGVATLRGLLREEAATVGIAKQELEARFAALVETHGLPRPRRNADLAVRGRFFEVDCLWRERRLIVELDGRAVHGTRRAFESDRERDRLLVADGWRVIRVTWRQMKIEGPAIARLLAELLSPPIPRA